MRPREGGGRILDRPRPPPAPPRLGGGAAVGDADLRYGGAGAARQKV